jgi:hypothetical protein
MNDKANTFDLEKEIEAFRGHALRRYMDVGTMPGRPDRYDSFTTQAAWEAWLACARLKHSEVAPC